MSFPSFEPEEPFVPGDEQPPLFELDWEIEALAQADADKPWFWFPVTVEDEDEGQLELALDVGDLPEDPPPPSFCGI